MNSFEMLLSLLVLLFVSALVWAAFTFPSELGQRITEGIRYHQERACVCKEETQ